MIIEVFGETINTALVKTIKPMVPEGCYVISPDFTFNFEHERTMEDMKKNNKDICQDNTDIIRKMTEDGIDKSIQNLFHYSCKHEHLISYILLTDGEKIYFPYTVDELKAEFYKAMGQKGE